MARRRHRVTRTQSCSRKWTWYFPSVPPPGNVWGPHTSTDWDANDIESMTDNPSSSRRFKPCLHETTKWTGGATLTSNGAPGKPDYRIMEFIGPWGHGSCPSLPVPDPAAFQNACWDALKSFSGELSPSVLGGNFLKELPELQRLGEFARKGKSIPKRLASAHLGWNFGVKPFISDLRKIDRALRAVDKRIQWHKDNSGKPVRVHFRTDLTPDLNALNTEPSSGTTGDVNVGWHTSCKILFSASATVSFNFPQRSLAEDRIRYLAGAMGFDRPLAFAWEATPYSFVVDWVYDVGRLAEQLTFDAWDVNYNVHEAGYSLKTWHVGDCRVYPRQDTNYGAYVVSARKETIRYERKLGIPAGSPFPSAQIPGLDQLLLGLSLLTQKA